MMLTSIKNIGQGNRTVYNSRKQLVEIRPNNTWSGDIHPHTLKILLRESRKENPSIEVTASEDDLVKIEQPGGTFALNESVEERLIREAKEAEVKAAEEAMQQAGEDKPEVTDHFITDPKTVPGTGTSTPEPKRERPKPKDDGKPLARMKSSRA